MNWPRLISKKELAIILGFYKSSTGRIYYSKLYQFIFNENLLSALKLTKDQIKKIRIFNIQMTEIILEHLDISQEEIDLIRKYHTIYK